MLRNLSLDPIGSATRNQLSTIRAWGCIGGCLAALSLLSACGNTPRLDARSEAQQYLSRASRDYTPPGPPNDPWGPYISEASQRFDVPERWIREVMRVESGGNAFQNGQPITSPAGAMGLMQVMPQTYDDMKVKYSLGDDPYHPHNSILAGTAYLREMYDVYGTPGFLAAYNAGPKRLDDYLANTRPLPAETRRYVANIAPYIAEASPNNRAAAEDVAMNQLPIDIPPGLRWGRHSESTRYAQATPRSYARVAYAAPRQAQVVRLPQSGPEVVQMPTPPTFVPPQPPVEVASASAPLASAREQHFRLIAPAMADTIPLRRGAAYQGGHWAIQVGAYGNVNKAGAAANAAARTAAPGAQTAVGTVRDGRGTLYRARVTGMSRDSAIAACEKISKSRKGGCMVISPDARG